MLTPKILVLAASLRAGSHNGRLAALVAKELTLAGADVTRVSLADYPLPLLDGDVSAAAGPPPEAIKLKRMLAAHQGAFIASPEYSASVTPLLKNAIDWVTRAAEGNEGPYAAFRGCAFAIGCAVPSPLGGMRGLMALRQILELGCGALVLPEQLSVGRADQAFDDMDNLKDETLTGTLKSLAHRLIDVASVMPRA